MVVDLKADASVFQSHIRKVRNSFVVSGDVLMEFQSLIGKFAGIISRFTQPHTPITPASLTSNPHIPQSTL